MSNLTQFRVSDIRKSLQTIRRAWERNEPSAPFLPSAEVMPGVTASEFCLHFVMSHHRKRHDKPR